MSAGSATRLRRARAEAGLCTVCAGTPVPGTRMCAPCHESARKRRRQYDQTDRAREMRRKRGRRYREDDRGGIPSRLDVARMRDAVAVAQAQRLGRVPTVSELREQLMRYGLGMSVPGVCVVRNRAFNIRPIAHDERDEHGNWPTIPFPVPAEYKAVQS